MAEKNVMGVILEGRLIKDGPQGLLRCVVKEIRFHITMFLKDREMILKVKASKH